MADESCQQNAGQNEVEEVESGQEEVEGMEQDLSDSGIFVLMELHEFMSQLFRSLPMKTLNTCAR